MSSVPDNSKAAGHDTHKDVSYILRPDGTSEPRGYSHVAVTAPGSRMVEISGQVGYLEDGSFLDTFEEQVLQAAKNLKACMKAAGVSLEHLLKIRHYVVDYNPSKLEHIAAAMKSVFGTDQLESPPGSLLVGVASLANPGIIYEVEAVGAIKAYGPSATITSALPLREITETDVVVVGAGLSGLQAAVDLQAAGLSTLVLEATGRVGGRTYSVNSTPHSPHKIDLGGAWINDTSQSRVWALTQKYGMQTERQTMKGLNLTIQSDGTVEKFQYGQMNPDPTVDQEHIIPFILAIDELAKTIDPKAPHTSSKASEYDNMSLAEFSRKYSSHPMIKQTADLMARAMISSEPEELSFLWFLTYIARHATLVEMISDDKHGAQFLRIKGGTMQLSERLAEELPVGAVQLATPVTNIQQLCPGAVRVTAGSGKAIYCKKVVVSAPTPAYSQINFSPPLPSPKELLSKSTILGWTSKVVLVFDEPWWRKGPSACSGSITSLEGPITFSRDTSYPDENLWSITCFINAKHAREWCPLPKLQREATIVQQFNMAMGTIFDNVPSPIAVHEHSWSDYQWYPGGPCPVMGTNVLTSGAGKALFEPHGDVHFVGTETSLKNPGYVDGALCSGSRGASEIISALEAVARAKL